MELEIGWHLCAVWYQLRYFSRTHHRRANPTSKDDVTDEIQCSASFISVTARCSYCLADPAKFPGAKSGFETVIESSWRYLWRKNASAHLTSGARTVALSAPGKGWYFYFDNWRQSIWSNNPFAQMHHCTTNCISPVAQSFTVVSASPRQRWPIHSYTDDRCTR